MAHFLLLHASPEFPIFHLQGSLFPLKLSAVLLQLSSQCLPVVSFLDTPLHGAFQLDLPDGLFVLLNDLTTVSKLKPRKKENTGRPCSIPPPPHFTATAYRVSKNEEGGNTTIDLAALLHMTIQLSGLTCGLAHAPARADFDFPS